MIMRQRLVILFVFSLTVSFLSAQTGLHVSELFGKEYQKRKNVVEVRVKGSKLERFRLTLFRSLTIKGDTDELQRIENLVKADGREAVDREEGTKGNRLYYGFYRLKIAGTRHRKKENAPFRYLFFRNNSLHDNKNHEAIVIYMEGFVSIDELKKMFR